MALRGNDCTYLQFRYLLQRPLEIQRWPMDMSGSNIPNARGVYGTLGVPAAPNIPGGRTNAVSWTDNSGNFWLFGGQGWMRTGGVRI